MCALGQHCVTFRGARSFIFLPLPSSFSRLMALFSHFQNKNGQALTPHDSDLLFCAQSIFNISCDQVCWTTQGHLLSQCLPMSQFSPVSSLYSPFAVRSPYLQAWEIIPRTLLDKGGKVSSSTHHISSCQNVFTSVNFTTKEIKLQGTRPFPLVFRSQMVFSQ